MRIDIMTLFPESINAVLNESIIGRAVKKGIIEVNCHQIRDYTDNKQKQVDDYPYGGGRGCVMMAQPLKSCLDSIIKESTGINKRIIYLTPQGQNYTQEIAKRLASDFDQLILICGHYEGIDERFIQKCVDEEISIGDFVLTGGEIASLVVADSVLRLIPGVLSDEECFTNESHWDGLLEYPQYTRPEIWEGVSVPKVLLDGNHNKIEHWRYVQQLKRTRNKRPDMFEKLKLSKDDYKYAFQPHITDVSYRLATNNDIDKVIEISNNAKRLLKNRKVDQWQGTYPSKKDYLFDLEKQQLYVVEDNSIIAFFVLSTDEVNEYNSITEGKWGLCKPYCTIQRLAIDTKYLGTELSDILISLIEKRTKELGYLYIRVDTHKDNNSMKRLLRENNFQYRGNVSVCSEHGHDPQRQAYEKVLKKND